MSAEVDQHLEEVLEKVKKGRAILFLGAGASFGSSAPGADALVGRIKKKFPKTGKTLSNLLDVCQDVVDTPPYSKQELENFVMNELGNLRPSDSHKRITQYDWSAIFTTNYDNLIEVGYQLSTQRLKPCYSIRKSDFSINLTDRAKVYLFKLMGCINQREQSDGCPILTRSDYNSALKRREKYLSYLFDFLKDGTVVFVGYSGQDRIVFEVFDELSNKYGLDSLPYSYIFLPKELSEKEEFAFTRRKMIHIPRSFEDFTEYLTSNYVAPDATMIVRPIFRLNLRGRILEMKDFSSHIFNDYFTLLEERFVNQDPGEKDDFFKGINQSFGAFKENWDFRREIYSGNEYGKPEQRCLKIRVLEELKKTSPNDNRVIMVLGMGGVGKTMMLKRLAYDVYKDGVAPVIITNPNRSTLDFKLLDSVLRRITRQFEEISDDEKSLKALILIDDAASQRYDPIKLKNYLASRSRPVTIVIAGRENDLMTSHDNILSRVQKGDIFKIAENLNVAEKKRIEEHLRTLGYLDPFVTWNQILDKTIKDSFFATMYARVHPSQKPLNAIIQSQYLKLKGLCKDTFEHICCFHQFNLPMNQELLVRTLGCSYAHFFDVLEKEAKGLIYPHEDSTGTTLYGTHHRIIAKKTMDFFFGDSEIQKTMFLRLLSDVHFSNTKERDLIEKLLISFLGPHTSATNMTNSQKRELFQLVCDQRAPRSIVHHWGLLEMEDGKFEKAEELLKKALTLPRRFEESLRGESEQNILTSLGTLYSRKGLDYLRNKDHSNAEKNFSEAQRCFINARLGGFPNAHAYHAHAYMFVKQGQEAPEMKEKIKNFAEALKILELARDNLNVEDREPIIELQTLVFDSLGRSSRVWENIHTLAKEYENPKGYYLYANWLRHRAFRKKSEELISSLQRALGVILDGLRIFSDEESLLMLRAKIMKRVSERNDFYQSLKDWYNCIIKNATTPSIWLLRELGIVCFELKFYDESKKHFGLLDELTVGHRLKFKLNRFMRSEKDEFKRFEGKIISTTSIRHGDIRVESLPNLRYFIRFRPYQCYWTPSPGELVEFNIGFDYVGPVAINLEKL